MSVRNGPPPRSPEAARLLGTSRRSPGVLRQEPAQAQPPPKGLRAAGKAAWVSLWEAGAGWLDSGSDAPLVTLVCEAFDDRADIRRQLKREGRTYTTSTGFLRPHPGVQQLAKLESQLTTWLGALGFSPTDRARLGLATPSSDSDELEELLSHPTPRQ